MKALRPINEPNLWVEMKQPDSVNIRQNFKFQTPSVPSGRRSQATNSPVGPQKPVGWKLRYTREEIGKWVD